MVPIWCKSVCPKLGISESRYLGKSSNDATKAKYNGARRPSNASIQAGSSSSPCGSRRKQRWPIRSMYLLRKSNKARKTVQRLSAVPCPIPCHGNDTAVHETSMQCLTCACKSCCRLRWCLTKISWSLKRIGRGKAAHRHHLRLIGLPHHVH